MHRIVRHRPSPALVIAVIALFVTLGGTTYALTIPRNSVGTAQLRDRAVTGRKVATGAIGPREVRESRLGAVRRALTADRLGGLPLARLAVGRSGVNRLCSLQENPLNCVVVRVGLIHPGRVLVIASSDWYNARQDARGSWGTCYLQFDGDTTIAGTETTFGETVQATDADHRGTLATNGISEALPRGIHSFALRCLEGDGEMVLGNEKISAVLLGSY